MVLSHERGQPPPKATKTRCEGPWLGNCHRSKASEGAGLEGWRGKNFAFCSVACRLMQTASVLLECSNAFQHSPELFKNGSSITKQMARELFSIPMELLAGYGLKWLKWYNDARTPSKWKLAKYVQIQFRAFHTFCFTFPISQQFGKEPCLRNHCQHCTCSFKRCSHHLGELSSSWQCGGRQGTVFLYLQALSQCQPLYEFAEPA